MLPITGTKQHCNGCMESQQAEGTVRTRLDDTTALDRSGRVVGNPSLVALRQSCPSPVHDAQLRKLVVVLLQLWMASCRHPVAPTRIATAGHKPKQSRHIGSQSKSQASSLLSCTRKQELLRVQSAVQLFFLGLILFHSPPV